MARVASAPETLPLFTFVGDNRTLTLEQPLMLRVAIEEDTYFVETTLFIFSARVPRSRKRLTRSRAILRITGATTALLVTRMSPGLALS
jgi:hypothetical protein